MVFKKIIFQNSLMANETPPRPPPPPLMANAIKNFHFDYLNPSLILYTCDSSRNFGGHPFPRIPWEQEQVGTWLPFQAEPQHVLFCNVIKIRALICSALQYDKKEIWGVLELECRLTDALVLLDYLELAVLLVSLISFLPQKYITN